MNNQQQKNDGFTLIWYYCYLRYIKQLNPNTEEPNDPFRNINIKNLIYPLKQQYHIQTIEYQKDKQSFQQRLSAAKQKALLSRSHQFFIIDPEQEIKQIDKLIRDSSKTFSIRSQIQPELEEMLTQLYSYYLNSKNIFIIYKSQSLQNKSISSGGNSQNRIRLILTHNSSESRLATSKDSKGSHRVQDDLPQTNKALMNRSLILGRSSDIVHKLLNQQDSVLYGGRGQSLTDNYERMENKIQQLQLLDKMAQFQGMQVWNCKYKHIPHSFVKFKKQTWTSLNLPLLHPSSPKTINEFPILPRIQKLKPSIDKLIPFVSYIKLLQKFFPNLLPTIDSIFQYNGLPYVFLEQDNGYASWKWQTNIGVLCYFVVFGDQDGVLTQKKVQRWIESNQNSLLAKTIRQMNKRQLQKKKKRKQRLGKSLHLINTQDSQSIW